jgi:hypothetical protein
MGRIAVLLAFAAACSGGENSAKEPPQIIDSIVE